MDELLIEDKKYVSSKQAAKMTGYAKDYIGQLCREGRVPARLVGRSWYVLESAIQDHRFGNSEPIKPSATPVVAEQPKWESPRYEPVSAPVIPTINQLEATQSLQESWQSWFNNFDTKPTEPEATVDVPIQQDTEEIMQEEVPISIHTVYELPPEELLPHRAKREFHQSTEEESDSQPVYIEKLKPKKRSHSGVIRSVQLIGVLLAIIMASLAIIGSGYLDSYIVSFSQARIIAGVSFYNR